MSKQGDKASTSDVLQVVGMGWGQPDGEEPFEIKRQIDYFNMFCADTAQYGDIPGFIGGYAFFGVNHILFGTDYPYDIKGGDKYIRQATDAVWNEHIVYWQREDLWG